MFVHKVCPPRFLPPLLNGNTRLIPVGEGAKLAFVVLRYQIEKLSCVLSAKDGKAASASAESKGHEQRTEMHHHQRKQPASVQAVPTTTTTGESFHHGTTGNEFFTEDPFVPPPTSTVPVDETSVTSSSTFNTTSTQSSSDTQGTRLTQPHLHTNPGPDVTTRASFVKWTTHLPRETLVLITGTLQRPANGQGKILEASPRLQGVELRIEKLFVLGRVREAPPFKFSDFRPVGEEKEDEAGGVKVSVRNELNNRVFDLRVSLRGWAEGFVWLLMVRLFVRFRAR